MNPRRLSFLPLELFLDERGQLRRMNLPEGLPTARQFATLNRLGCLFVVEPGQASRLTRADAAGAIDAALVLRPDALEAPAPAIPPPARPRDVAGELERLFADGVWRTKVELRVALAARPSAIREALTASPGRFVWIAGYRVGRHPAARLWGTWLMREALEREERSA